MNDWNNQSARNIARALRDGILTSEALTGELLARIRNRNPALNAVIHLEEEQAMEQARTLDEERRQGHIRGLLHGMPMTIKDVWEVSGMPCTAGSSGLREHVPERDADVVQRLRDAGAIIMGKTNVPVFASDLQTYNRLHGVTNNPYDPSRTPGGSSGGAAAALAAGMTPLEVGSDLGGSIRTPAHFCGVFGHKPSRGILSLRGHIPGPPGTLSQPDMAEGGPMARCADDLEFLLEIIAAPRPHEGPHWRLALPKPASETLKGTRVVTRFDDPVTPVEATLTQRYEAIAETLSELGAHVSPAAASQLEHTRLLPLYHNLLGSLLGTGFKPKQRRNLKWMERFMRVFGRWMRIPVGLDQYAVGVNQSFLNYIQNHERREKMRAALVDELFSEADVLLTPVTPTTAILHDQSQPMFRRTIDVNGEKRPYTDQMNWIALATLLGLPATSAPVGRDADGMPFGIQIIGAPGQDLTTIRFAQLLEEQGLSGFTAPQ
ncbi:amidase [Halospina denitrificans]|uniref:Amidase n=1 Tax=Halospina denitrificans TaxID=332522 RepID=A0A4R7K000_9GAMM|nr:amidase family protein [Halospina denitrificans]TDT43153.1 amidase [Halospina denitrificans]